VPLPLASICVTGVWRKSATRDGSCSRSTSASVNVERPAFLPDPSTIFERLYSGQLGPQYGAVGSASSFSMSALVNGVKIAPCQTHVVSWLSSVRCRA